MSKGLIVAARNGLRRGGARAALAGGLFAATALTAVGGFAAPAMASTSYSFYTGTLAPNQAGSWTWNHADPNSIYSIALNPVGATTSSACTFRVENQYYQKNYSGEMEFHYTVRNISSGLSCGAYVSIIRSGVSVSQQMGTIVHGQTATYNLPIGDAAANLAWFAGVEPLYPSSTYPCKMAVTRQWIQGTNNGNGDDSRTFYFQITNTGGGDCVPVVHAGSAPTYSTVTTTNLGPANTSTASRSMVWNQISAGNAVVPTVASVPSDGWYPHNCSVDFSVLYYTQTIRSSGASWLSAGVTMTNNTFQKTCTTTLKLGYIA